MNERVRNARTTIGFWTLIVALIALLVLSLALAVAFGSVRIPLDEVFGIVVHQWWPGVVDPFWSDARHAIVWDSRLPRGIMAAAVGASLALAGTSAQAVTRNPLADPYLLGVSSGAGFGVVCVSILGIGGGMLGQVTTPVAAFVGGMVPLLLAVVIGGRFGDPTMMGLVGVAVSAIFSALTTFVLLVIADEHQLANVMRWQTGSFGDAAWDGTWPVLISTIVVGGLLLATSRRLDLLHAGDDGAAALGLDVRRFRLVQLVFVSLLAGMSVAAAGGIGFVGLIVPHVAGFFVGTIARRQLPASALIGACALVLADLLSRAVSATLAVPVGVVTALVGAPAFLWLLIRQYARRAQ